MSITRRKLLILAAAVGIVAGPVMAHAEDVLNVGAYPTNPPFEYKNESGTFEGFEVDIVNEAAKRIGMKTEIADLGFQALFAAVNSKRIDVAISSITITPPEPAIEASGLKASNSSFTSSSSPESTGADDPPGMTAFTVRPSGRP